ncbi:Taurine catabolism dioxygenase TauD, TfdA family [Variovorax sp. YR750]|uniref:TauD/TfdA family dioxygenase n=1 Tax=Variovorax sp. YR750 TaxID=1884384 RepID=UPI0008AD13D6|nr:TauD/TfdA family dioxygenase [Variovorax sp. YR750]SEK40646.1 Taurine catabolism dioxygenase TauD, TfdA family [Variovorax sp. YR750]
MSDQGSRAEVSITASEAEQIRQVLGDLDYDPAGSSAYIGELRRRVYSGFPERLVRLLEVIKSSNSAAYAYLVVDNLPIDSGVRGSPQFGETGRQFKDGVLSENLLAALGAAIGEPYSISHEGLELVNNLTPHKHTRNDYTGLGSEVELDFHIENAAQAFMPEGDTSPLALLLLGLRAAPEGEDRGPFTRVADARLALARLSDEDLEALYGRNFIIRVPYRWRGATPTPRDNTDLSPVLSGPLELPRVTVAFYPDMVLPVNQRARTALENFHREVRAVSEAIDIKPGRLVFVNNRFALHSRDSFVPSFDANDRAYRWVQRIMVTTNLWNFRSFGKRQERVFDPFLLPRASEPVRSRNADARQPALSEQA